jgi:soluble lytic murein transglycosylase
VPTVPLYGAQRVDPTALPDPQQSTVASPGLLGQGATQQLQQGQALEQAGTTASNIMQDSLQMANQVRVNDAVNQLKTYQQALTYDPNQGFMHQTGLAALQRPSGQPLADEYVQKLNDQAATISANLNPAQQRLFSMQAQDMAAQLHGQATQWEGQQFRAYQGSVNDGTIKTAQNDTALFYNDPDRIQKNLDSIDAAVYANGKLNGLAAVDIEAGQRQAKSGALTAAITGALQKGNVTYADGLMQKYAPQMTADDILRINGHMNQIADHTIAAQVVGNAMSQAGSALSNSPFDRMVAITLKSESNGKDLAPDGSVLTSSAGAKGSMQVEDTTNTNPGFGVTPAQNNSLAERARVGRDYLQALLGHYGGDPAKAWAAYNGGPGTLDAAMAQAQKDGKPAAWLTYMPQETQAYVANNVAALNSNTGALQRPSKLDVVNAVRNDPALQGRPERIQLAVTLAGQQYDEQTAAIKQTDDANKAAVFRVLDQNRGNVNALDPVALAKLNPADIPDVLDYARKVSQGTNATNTALYQTFITTPKMMADMTNDQWQTQAQNFSVDDFKHLSQIRADLINNTGSNSPGSINLRAMNETLTQRLQSMGINPFPKATGFGADPETMARVGAIRQFVTQDLLEAQKEAGKKFTEADIANHIDSLFTKSVTFGHTLNIGPWAIKRPDTTMNMMSMTPADIPDDVRATLISDFRAHGVANPTPGQMLGAYWQMKTAQQQLSSQ